MLGAIADLDTRAPADVFVIGALVGVLEAAPAAQIVDEEDLEVRATRPNDLEELLHRLAPLETQPALAGVVEGADDFEVVLIRVVAENVALVLERVLLLVGRHAAVLGGGDLRRHR